MLPSSALLSVIAACTAAQAQPAPAAAPNRPNPFTMLQTLDAGRIASSWSSLPSGEGCRDDDRQLAGHALQLLESAAAQQDTQPEPFSLVKPRHRLQTDNRCTGADCSDQTGNQLFGCDLRVSLDRWLAGVALYGQLIGEDSRSDNIPLPAKNLYLAGVEWRHQAGLAFVAWTDSTAKLPGIACNHFIFTDGCRCRGQPLGHWSDGDSDVESLGGLLRDVLGGQALAVLRHGQLNQAGANPTWPSARFGAASLQWRTVPDRVFGLTFALDHSRFSPHGTGGAQGDTQLRVQCDAWFD